MFVKAFDNGICCKKPFFLVIFYMYSVPYYQPEHMSESDQLNLIIFTEGCESLILDNNDSTLSK